jgi:hypothetical protein
MTYTEQLEREAERTRRELADTLEQLRARITPGQVLDQAVDYVRDSGGGEFLHNLKRQAVDNPLPVTLIGAGMAWLMTARGSNGSASGRSKLRETAEKAGGAFGDAADAGARMTGAARSGAASAWDSASGAASSTYDSAAGTYRSATANAARAASAVSGSARSLGRNAAETGSSIVEFCREQPLVLAGLGMALGAVAAAIMPSTETEDRLMGDMSDTAKEKVRGAASATYEKAQAVGDRAMGAARQEAESQGLASPADGEVHRGEDRRSGADDSAPRSGGAGGPNVNRTSAEEPLAGDRSVE